MSMRSIHRLWGCALLVLVAVPATSCALDASATAQAASPTYSAQQMRAISVFGARLSMRLEAAREALIRNGFRRVPFPSAPPTNHEAQVLEANYRHPSENTSVGLFYSQLPNGERRIGRIVLWEEIPVMNRTSFGRFLAERYGEPSVSTVFQDDDIYVWSQQPVPWSDLLTSMQCMMSCLSEGLIGRCNSRTISRQVYMSGSFNTNMPGKLYWGADLNDLQLQQSAMLSQGSFPASRPACPSPVT